MMENEMYAFLLEFQQFDSQQKASINNYDPDRVLDIRKPMPPPKRFIRRRNRIAGQPSGFQSVVQASPIGPWTQFT
jgi:hypothetical protein